MANLRNNFADCLLRVVFVHKDDVVWLKLGILQAATNCAQARGILRRARFHGGFKRGVPVTALALHVSLNQLTSDGVTRDSFVRPASLFFVEELANNFPAVRLSRARNPEGNDEKDVLEKCHCSLWLWQLILAFFNHLD